MEDLTLHKCSEGIYLVGRYGNPPCGTWLFVNNSECLIVEMPPFFKRQGRPIDTVREFIDKYKLSEPKYILASHSHMDHTYSIFHYKKAFPDTKILVHSSFLNDYFIRCYIYMYWTRNKRIYGENIANTMGLFDEVFATDFYQLDLGGEPLYLIYAPKHSYEDTMIVFKGAMITGDWVIGPYPDCNDVVSYEDKARSIDRLMEKMHDLNYGVHMLFSVHGDTLMYNVDFYGVMSETKDYCIKNSGNSRNYISILSKGK